MSCLKSQCTRQNQTVTFFIEMADGLCSRETKSRNPSKNETAETISARRAQENMKDFKYENYRDAEVHEEEEENSCFISRPLMNL